MMDRCCYVICLWCLVTFYSIEAIEVLHDPQGQASLETYKRPSVNGFDSTRRERRTVVECPGSNTTKRAVVSQTKNIVECGCQPINSLHVSWLDLDCKIVNNDHVTVTNQSLTISSFSGNTSIFYCTNNYNCTEKIVLLEQIAVSGMSPALQGFVMFLILIFLLATLCFLYKKYRFEMYLGCRDSCASSSGHDGKEFDAYVSLGKSVNDIKFAEKNIIHFLQKKHNYNLFVDEDSLLPRLDYSEKVQNKMHLCRRLIIVFTPAYMTNEWCMYCFSEGLRKLLELNIDIIFIITDASIQREINALSSVVGRVPKLFISTLPLMQSKENKNQTLQKLRLLMPPAPKHSHPGHGLEEPILRDVEDIDQRSLPGTESYGGMKYTFGKASSGQKAEVNMDDLDMSLQEMEYDDEDPASIRVNQYKPRKDFLRIAMVDENGDDVGQP